LHDAAALAAEADPPSLGLPCINSVAYGADPSGARDSGEAIATAIRNAAWAASSSAPGVVCLPAVDDRDYVGICDDPGRRVLRDRADAGRRLRRCLL
jgi:hypothetical protein